MMETVEMTRVTSKRYPAYKESREDWIGEIPSHWDVVKLKHLFVEKKATANPSLPAGSISYGKVVTKDDEKIPVSTKASYQEVLKGEFLINPLNLNYDLVSLRIGLSYIDVVVSPGYIVLKTIADVNKEYYRYLLHRYDVAYMKLLGSGVRQTINFNHISSSLLLLPPKNEQTRIAEFLDKKTIQIEHAIAQKERQIELLKERRQILINSAVTHGLDPNGKLKNSGIQWIGEIPEHWETKKAKFLFKKEERYVGKQDEIVTCFRDGQVTLRKNRKTEGFTNALKEHGYQGVRKGDLVIHNMDAFAGAIGVSDSDGKSTPVYSICTPIDKELTNCYYYAFFLREMARRGFIESLAKGIRERSTDFRFNDFSILFLPVPPIIEQNMIVVYIEKITFKIANMVTCKVKEIEKLKEYKATLINAAVTGKIKV
jgi:type I restriction enzyme, S subunit